MFHDFIFYNLFKTLFNIRGWGFFEKKDCESLLLVHPIIHKK